MDWNDAVVIMSRCFLPAGQRGWVGENVKLSWLILGVFLIFLGIYLLTSGGHFHVTDEGAMCFMAESIVDHGWFDVPLNPNTRGGRIGPDGLYYMPFGVMQPLLSIPFLILGRWAVPWGGAYYLSSMVMTWFNAFITAWLMACFTRFLIDLGVSMKRAVWLGIGSGLSTCFWVYSGTYFTEPLTALAILISARQIHLYGRTGSLVRILNAGIWAAMMVIVRPLSGIVLPVLFLYLILWISKRSRTNRSANDLKPVIIFLLIILAGIGLLLIYNYLRFGALLETGYDRLPSGQPRSFTMDPVTGLKILLFSPGKSFFLFNPLCLAAIPGIVIGLRKSSDRPLAVFSLLTPVMFLLVLSQWGRVEGGVSWGPRLMIPAVTAMLLGLAPLALVWRSRGFLYFTGFFAAIGIAVQIAGVSINFSSPILQDYDAYFNPDNGVYQYDFNPLPIHYRLLYQEIRTLNDVDRYPETMASEHRLLLQTNPSEGLDLWVFHLWYDRVSTGFIVTLALLQGTFFLCGLFLVSSLLRVRDIRET